MPTLCLLCLSTFLTATSGVPIQAPIVDGLSGTVFAMEATIRALVNNLPPERKANPSVAILGGGGYIGSRLVSVLANTPQQTALTTSSISSKGGLLLESKGSLLAPQSSFNLEVEPTAAQADTRTVGMTAVVNLRDKAAPVVPTPKQIIALDTRYAGNRHSKAGVLYTAEAKDLEAADVVLVITRNGDDVAEYVKHAQPGQVGICFVGFGLVHRPARVLLFAASILRQFACISSIWLCVATCLLPTDACPLTRSVVLFRLEASHNNHRSYNMHVA